MAKQGLNFKIKADVNGAVRGLKRVGGASKGLSNTFKKMTIATVGVGLAMEGAQLGSKALAGAINLVANAAKDSLKWLGKTTIETATLGDRMAKQARMVGVTAGQYQGYEFAAERAGTSVTAVSNGLKKLGRVMVDAQAHTGQLRDTFNALEIDYKNADGTLRDVNDVFNDFADVSAALGPSAERTGVLMLLLGRSGTELANMMSGGSAELLEMHDRMEELGAIMSQETLRASELYIDSQADLKFAFRGLKIELTEQLIPAFTGVSSGLVKIYLLAKKKGILKKWGADFADAVIPAIYATAALGRTMEQLALMTKGAYHIAVATAHAISMNFGKAGKAAGKAVAAFAAAGDKTRLDKWGAGADILVREIGAARAAIKDLGDDDVDPLAGLRARLKALLAALDELNKKKTGADPEKEAKAALAAWKNYYKLFRKLDKKEIIEQFMWRKTTEDQFRGQMHAEALTSAKEHLRKMQAALDAALDQGLISHLQYNEDLKKMQEHYDRTLERSQMETNEKVAERRVAMLSDFTAVAGATSQIFGTLSDLAMQAYERGDEKAKAAAIAMFHISQALALATAVVNTAMSVTAALAKPPGPPETIPQAIAAGILGGVQIATIIGTSVAGIGDAGLTSDTLRQAGLNNHSAIVMRNDETLLDPVGTKHITEMLAIQKAQMMGGGGGGQTIRTTVELDGRVLGEAVDTYLIRQQERGLQYSDRIRQEYV